MEGQGASTAITGSAGSLSIILGGSCAALVCCSLAHLRFPVACASTEGRAACDITGGCLCGAVRYRVSTPAKSTYHCHCLMCRKIHGALFATFSVFPSTSWKLTKGQLSVYCSSPGTTRQFCGTCGCQILSTVSSVDEDVFVTCGSMDAHVHPGHSKHTEAHIFAADRTCWKDFVSIDTDVTRFDGYETGGSGISVDAQGKLN